MYSERKGYLNNNNLLFLKIEFYWIVGITCERFFEKDEKICRKDKASF